MMAGRFGSTACLVLRLRLAKGKECSMIFVNRVQTDKDETTEIQRFSRPLSLLENELSIRTLKYHPRGEEPRTAQLLAAARAR